MRPSATPRRAGRRRRAPPPRPRSSRARSRGRSPPPCRRPLRPRRRRCRRRARASRHAASRRRRRRRRRSAGSRRRTPAPPVRAGRSRVRRRRGGCGPGLAQGLGSWAWRCRAISAPWTWRPITTFAGSRPRASLRRRRFSSTDSEPVVRQHPEVEALERSRADAAQPGRERDPGAGQAGLEPADSTIVVPAHRRTISDRRPGDPERRLELPLPPPLELAVQLQIEGTLEVRRRPAGPARYRRRAGPGR